MRYVPRMEIAMSDSAVGVLSEREAKYLDQLRQAKAQGISLAEHCRRRGLSVNEFYQIARELAGRRVAGRRGRASRKTVSSPRMFAPVRITPAAASTTTTMCRIKHLSGWVIECAALPSASWLAALTRETPL
jgi:hypothetical protein